MSVNSHALRLVIEEKIQKSDGFIPFDTFMQSALYEPGLGYYETGQVFGEGGDFVTGADLGPWLALGFADLMFWGWQQLGQPKCWVLLEQGGGSGRLLTQVLEYLKCMPITMPTVAAVERSAWMRERQRQHYEQTSWQVEQYAELEDVKCDGPVLMMCNELPDAFPVRCFEYKKKDFYERVVGIEAEQLVWMTSPEPMSSPPSIDENIKTSWPESYQSEFNPRLAGWQKSVGNLISEGFVFCVDYGYSQKEYYRANRIEGTLMGHKSHQVIEDLLAEPGTCDLTAHIDFTSLARIGEDYGLITSSFITQGGWLAQSPSVQSTITGLAGKATVESLQAIAQAKRMLLPFGMGESFKLLVQAKGAKCVPDYLQSLDRIGDLQLLPKA
ncbi:MAG: SAM-dependent methyltransferase [Mariprofundaceae bacterium]